MSGGSQVTGYNVYRSEAIGGTYSLLVSQTGTTYNDTTVTNGHTYYYEVSANNSAGEGSKSSLPVSAMPYSVPGAPIGLGFTPGNGQISLNWSAPFNGGRPITGYNVYRSLADPVAYTLIGTTTGLTYSDASVANGATYLYAVSANNSAGEGPKSLPVTTVPFTVPGVADRICGDRRQRQQRPELDRAYRQRRKRGHGALRSTGPMPRLAPLSPWSVRPRY